MAGAYSTGLRERVLAAMEAGKRGSCRPCRAGEATLSGALTRAARAFLNRRKGPEGGCSWRIDPAWVGLDRAA